MININLKLIFPNWRDFESENSYILHIFYLRKIIVLLNLITVDILRYINDIKK